MNWRSERVRRRGLLVVAVAALLVSFVGAAVHASVTGSPDWWGGHTFDRGHMTWWGDDRSDDEPTANARELVVAATDYSFAPAELTVTVGEPVNLTLRNDGRLPHDLVIPELGVHVTTGPGRQAATGIVADGPGAFEIVRTFPGNATAGMTGQFKVLSN